MSNNGGKGVGGREEVGVQALFVHIDCKMVLFVLFINVLLVCF